MAILGFALTISIIIYHAMNVEKATAFQLIDEYAHIAGLRTEQALNSGLDLRYV